MIIEVTNIVAGQILAMGILPNIPATSKSLKKVAKWLGRFQKIIGIIAIILGIWFWVIGDSCNHSWTGIDLRSFSKHTAIGKGLAKVVKWLGSFQTIISILAIILGVLGILEILV